MRFIDYLSSSAMPIIFLLIVLYALIEKKKVFDIFLVGAKDGVEITLKIFPTLVQNTKLKKY